MAYPLTVCRFAMGGIFTTKLYPESKTFGYHKTICGERNPAYCKCAVSGCFYLSLPNSFENRYGLIPTTKYGFFSRKLYDEPT